MLLDVIELTMSTQVRKICSQDMCECLMSSEVVFDALRCNAV